VSATLQDSVHLVGRRLRPLLRQPVYLAFTLSTPVIWLFLFGQLFRGITVLPGFPSGSYLSFLVPGIVIMTAMLSSGWAGTNYVADMDRGILDRLLVTPTRRVAIVAGDLGTQAITTVVQSLIILGLGLLAGARFPGGVGPAVALLVAAVLVGWSFAALSIAVALLVRRQESIIAIFNFLGLPLSFLSSTLMPAQLMPAWIQAISRFNPISWGVTVGRQLLAPAVAWGTVGSHLLYLLALAAALIALCSAAFGSYQRSA